MNVPYKIIDRRGNETKPNQGQNSNYNIEPNVWTTITARTDGKKQSLMFTDADGNQLTDIEIIDVTDDRKIWKNAVVYLSKEKTTAASIKVKNFIVTDLDCNEPTQNWVAQCYQNRSTNLTDDNLDNCLVTADFGTAKECYKCENGYTYDEK